MIKLNGFHIDPTFFPDGTLQVWKLPEEALKEENEIEWVFDSNIELMTVAQIRTLLGTKAEISLVMPFLPYARQDKNISNDLTFAFHTFMSFMVDLIRPEIITVFDPHSDLIKAYCKLYNIELKIVMPNIDVLAQSYDYVVFPDKGAASKYQTTKPVIIGNKVRNQSTGFIESYSLDFLNPENPSNLYKYSPLSEKRVLVIDDICDGGATFVKLGECLNSFRCEADLYISHGIFSKGQKGINELHNYYEKIFTTNSLTCNSDPDPINRYSRVKVFDWIDVSRNFGSKRVYISRDEFTQFISFKSE